VTFGVDLAGTTVDIDFAGFDAAAGLRRPTIEDFIAGPLKSYGLMIRGAPSYPKGAPPRYLLRKQSFAA
jgi:hypothetical protein